MKLKRISMLLLALLMFFSISTQGFANKGDQVQDQSNLTQVLSDEVILSLTEDDLGTIFDILLEYKEKNPIDTEEELDGLATKLYIEAYNKKTTEIKPSSY